ncbi:MAG: HEPN domain-containing protein [Thermoplasmata archaeon]
MTADEEFKRMIEGSKQFLLNAERNLDEGFIDIGSFSANQSLELYLKALMLKDMGDYTHIHDLKTLLRNLSAVSDQNIREKIEFLLKEKSLILSLIQDAYLTSRYFFTSYSADDLREMISIIKSIQEMI